MGNVSEYRFELDFRSGVPIYEQIVDQVRSRITAGILRPGNQLPTVRQLALELRVNFNTIARAYRILDQAGLISTQQGRGTYILEPSAPDIPIRLRRAELVELVDSFLSDASRHQYALDEIETCVWEQIQRRRDKQSLVE